jgi:hypothetical protein
VGRSYVGECNVSVFVRTGNCSHRLICIFFTQLFTKSTDWYDESKGWKSTQGGFSAIQQFSTDGNNMGGLFVRKLAGAAAAGVHAQKLVPLVIHPTGAQWAMGHYRPLLSTALVGNLALLAFYASYLHDLVSGGAGTMTYGILATLAVESLVILAYLVTARPSKRGPAVAMPDGKTPSSLTSRILSRTVMLVSPILAAVAVRDLLFPGFVFSFLPRDDIYLEWTNAFLHSPPEGSEEELDQGLTAPLYIGDKFVSQLAAVNILIICLYKCVTSFVIRYGSDGSGLIKCRMIWQVQAFAGAFVTFVFRLFTPAARAVGFDFRWHLMCLSYETFIICTYYLSIVGFFCHSTFVSLDFFSLFL